jgi:DNA-binding NarL/FixJ family response regulator
MSRLQLEAKTTEEGASPSPRPLRVAVLDSHRLFRECLAAALRDDDAFARVEVADAERTPLAELAAAGPLDVLVLGSDDTAGFRELLRQARALLPNAKILVLGTEDGQEEALGLLREGAKGYLSHNQSFVELRDAILRVATGATVCTPRIAHLLFAHLAEVGAEGQRRYEWLDLTARELEILQLIAAGLKNQQIAERLYLSVHTVKNHIRKILSHLGVQSRWSAVAHAFERQVGSGAPMNVFLSFSNADRQIAAKLRTELWRLGLKAGSDNPALELGAERRHHVEDAIRSTETVVVLIRPEEPDEAQQDSWQEILSATWQDPAKQIFLLLIEGATVPAFIYSSSWPFQVLKIADPRDPREIEAVARAVADALKEGSASEVSPRRSPKEATTRANGSVSLPVESVGPSAADLAAERSERLSEIRRYAELLKQRA